MRATRVLTAALLVLAGATVTAGPAGSVTPARNAVTGSQDPISGGAPFAYDSTVSAQEPTAGELAGPRVYRAS